MKARELIESAAFDPDQLKIIYQAFDAAWKQIAPDVRPSGTVNARLKLAAVVLSVARTGIASADHIKDAALTIMFANPTEL